MNLSVSLMNCQFLVNKTTEIVDYVIEDDVDGQKDDGVGMLFRKTLSVKVTSVKLSECIDTFTTYNRL